MTIEVIFAILAGLVVFIGLVFIYDITQKKHAILHNYPVLGHMRYFLEMIGPELRQYWVAHDKEEMPFDRTERSWIYATSKGANNYSAFGTTELQYGIGYPIIKNAAFPFPEKDATYLNDDPSAIPCVKIVGEMHNRRRPWRPNSIVNVSAMSFGALGKNAISALNLGAGICGCYHNTGEGGVSKYHLLGGTVVWQIGTGYFGACDKDGKFSIDVVADRVAKKPQIRAIEIKL